MPPIGMTRHKATPPIKGGSKPKFGPQVGSEHLEMYAGGEVGGWEIPISKHLLQRCAEDHGQCRAKFYVLNH